MIKRNLGIAALFALAACSQAADDSNIAVDETVNAAEAANADVEVLPADETSASGATDTSAGTQPGDPNQPVYEEKDNALIPSQYRGRWGMNANDCDPSRSDNKGLLTIDGSTLRFYESRATLKEQRPAIATSFSGLFAFSGEGQTWEKVITFTRTGDTLKRAESDGTYTYKRCA